MTSIVWFVLGGVLLIGGAELLIRGASRLAVSAGISPLVVGLTVVAFGTSAPELAVTVGAAVSGNADIALGNVVGSNIANVLLILGLSAAVTPLKVPQQVVRLEVPLMIGASLLTVALAADGALGQVDGLLLFVGIVAYTVLAIRQSRRESEAVRAEYAEAFPGIPPHGGWKLLDVAMIGVGLGLLVLGARWLVAGAVAVALALGVSELVVGLSLVAVGTSLPELATSVLAAIRGHRDIAVGNVVGSNLFNLLAVLGLGSAVSSGGISVAPGTLAFDFPVMIAVAVACLPIFFTGYQISRWEGWLFLGYYGAYLGYLWLASTDHDALSAYNAVLLGFLLPLTVATVTVLAFRAAKKSRLGSSTKE